MAASPNPIKKLSVLLPANLHRRAKRLALMNDQTLTNLIIGLLETHLDQAEQNQAGTDNASSS